MGTPNWAKLVTQGRAKAIGVAWSVEELKALSLEIPAEYVRRGALTVEKMEKIKAKDEDHLKKNGEKSTESLERAELLEKAKKISPNITNQATDEALRSIISENEKKDDEAKKTEAAKAKKAKEAKEAKAASDNKK